MLTSFQYVKTHTIVFILFILFSIPNAFAMDLIAKIQAFGTQTNKEHIYDIAMQSPKSAAFSKDGKKLYINALEGLQTLVYSYPELKKIGTISHTFDASHAPLFLGQDTIFNYSYYSGTKGSYNIFSGKPVEMAFSHHGKFLWIPYYRRSFDANAASPSAVAIIDTQTDKIVRIMPTGPLPKYVAISPDSRWAVITHWGDNTLALMDISSQNPSHFSYTAHWVVDHKVPPAAMHGDRDRNCSQCLRGTTFTPDGKTVLVARMGGGGIAGFHVDSGKYLGTIGNVVFNPRHILVSSDAQYLYVSGNQSGLIGRYPLQSFLSSLYQAEGKTINGPKGDVLHVGSGARTIALDEKRQTLYVAVNNNSSLVKVDLTSWQILQRDKVDNFAVGLAIHPFDPIIVTTSQGRSGLGGGHSVNIFKDTNTTTVTIR